MPSDRAPRRLHPASVLFNLMSEVKVFALPALLVLFGAGSGDDAWRLWSAVFILPAAGAAVARYFTFTYTYAEDELIVRSGLFFKRERHVPYHRIQNIDARQNVAHALFGVYAVTLETGGGAEAEAELSVLPAAALAEMRARVFAGRAATPPAIPETDAAAAPAPDVLLQMGLRDLALCGLVRGRGLLLLGAILGTLSQYGVDDRVIESGERPEGPVGRAVRSLVEGFTFDLGQLIAAGVLLMVLVGILRVLSMIYTIQRLYGFMLVLDGSELRMTYGLLTRIRATIPVRRIQTLTVREGPLHRLFGVCSIRADTAGGEANAQAAGSREWLAPIIDKAAAARFITTLMPEARLENVMWQPPHDRAFRRALIKPLVLTAIAAFILAWNVGLWALPSTAALVALAVRHARLRVRHMGHALLDEVFVFRSGWFWRHTTVAPVRKVQVVAISESPFDRRHGMARLAVDTAGADGSPHALNVPWLARERAESLSTSLGASAADSALTW
jgi:putative membrane protein